MRLYADAPAFTVCAWALLAAIPLTLTLLAVDHRRVDGANVWLKPLKFEISLVLYLLTLAWCARALPDPIRDGTAFRTYAWVVVGCIAVEMGWLVSASVLATRSHFNTSRRGAPLYQAMGLIAVGLTSPTLVMGLAIAGNPATGLSPSLHLALWLGLCLTFLLTVPVAGMMAGGTAPGRTGPTWPLTGWSRSGPDLRPAHFLATHTLQILPLAALVLPSRAAVWTLALATVAATLWQVRRARRGLPPI